MTKTLAKTKTPVAGNKLTQLLDIPEPRPQNLRTADFRINAIASLEKVASKLSSFIQLQSLALDINMLQSVTGLGAFRGLLKLSVSQNRISSCAGLEQLLVRTSDFQCSCLFNLNKVFF